jgi:DNA helicase-2/ATP-dependent DNA helicase PcrA
MDTLRLRRLTDELSEDQLAAVTDPASALCVRAPAGSGKTRVLTRRVAFRAELARDDESIAPQQHMTVVTFTRKAAVELQTRLSQLGTKVGRAGTFHALALAQLQKWYSNADRKPPVVCKSSRTLLLDFLRKDVETAKELKRQFGVTNPGPQIDDFIREISLAKAHDQLPADPLHRWVMDIYQRQLKRAHVIDFDDLILEVTARFNDDQSFAAAQRYVWRSFFVDEAQDLTPAQLGLIKAWRGDHPELFVVGDPAQAIYGWAGTSPDTLQHPQKFFGEMQVRDLRQSFRSTAQITHAAQRVLSNTNTHAISQREAGVAPHVVGFDTEQDEVAGIVRIVADKILKHGVRPRDIAVLARTRAQLDPFVAAFRDARIATVRASSDDDTNEIDVDGVNVLTFHAAKGLEWPHVFVVGVEDGLVPLWRSPLDEEQRLFYVALTRAQDELNCSWAAQRTIGSRSVSRQPSPWLTRVAQTHDPAAAPSARRDPVIDLRQPAVDLSEERQRLTAWRANRARQTGLTIEQILDPETFEEILLKSPSNVQELKQITSLSPIRRMQLGLAIITTLHGKQS